MNWLTSLPAAALVAACLAVAFAAAVAGRSVANLAVPAAEHEQLRGLAAPLMAALGAAFAVMIALTLSSEESYLRAAQAVVSDEAAAASRLAWAANAVHPDADPIHATLSGYLEATRRTEWRDDSAAHGSKPAEDAVKALETAVRSGASGSEVTTPVSTELLVALDGITSARRARLAAASIQIPALFVVTLVVSGLALAANAGALASHGTRRAAFPLIGLVAVVGLSLALLFALGAPWRGPLIVDGAPLDSILADLRSGFFVSSLQ